MSTVGLFQHFHHKDSVLWDGRAQEVQEMNSIELGAFCSDFPKDWVKNQQRQKKKKSTPQWPAREVCKSQRSPSFAWAEYILVYHALNMWKAGRAVRCFSFGPKGFKGFPVSKRGFEVEHWWGVVRRDGSKLTTLWGHCVISGFWFPTAKQTRTPGALNYPWLSLWTEGAKFPTRPKTELISPVYLCIQTSANLSLFWFHYHHNTLWHGIWCCENESLMICVGLKICCGGNQWRAKHWLAKPSASFFLLSAPPHPAPDREGATHSLS